MFIGDSKKTKSKYGMGSTRKTKVGVKNEVRAVYTRVSTVVTAKQLEGGVSFYQPVRTCLET